MILVLLVVRETSLLFLFQGQVQSMPVTRVSQQEDSDKEESPKHGDVFVPGSLSLSRLETYHKCFVDPCQYRHHYRREITCDVSDKYNLTYYMIGKAASSTCRSIMNETFQADDMGCLPEEETAVNDNMFRFTFVRDPYSRFLSAYRQAFLISFKRGRKTPVPEKYYPSFKEPFENMTISDYLHLFERARGQQKMKSAMQNFILAYDAEFPFDGHLRLQVPRLAAIETGRTRRLEGIFDTKDIDEQFAQIASMVNAPPPPRSLKVHVRDKEVQIDATDLTRRLRRKICQLSAIDYCCLNYELPEACKGAVQCQWKAAPENPEELLIESLSQYPPPRDESSKETCQAQRKEFNRAVRKFGNTYRMVVESL
ncbi:expressed unknown protein [Seminavis robusta]|uniref:Uncharacterized protein n=1 Tax=Seminavis robusta TaxID=568900 RepID=A0A9N8EX43_9STRA|nr:expressed unknown protein [Seminavis robusta]|eukprot:Sro2338_g323950.1 n/a (369) ;mRNA; f:14243-15349